ncbi:MAG: tyrosine-type recombinase/integrase [Actinomycetota bacterium]|nr:tyrosine-type recombinase/integrase [Actinomycetota bacterium]
MTKRRKNTVVEESGVRVRLFRRGDRYWLDVRVEGRERMRVSAETGEREVAEANARKLAREIAMRQLLGVTSDSLTLGQLFASYHEHKGRTLNRQWKRGAETRSTMFKAVWGESLPVAQVSQTYVDSYCNARRSRKVAPKSATARMGKGEALASLRDGALDSDFSWLSSVFNWALRHKLATGKRLLEHNPLHDCEWPHEKNIRRPIASHDRYVRTLARTDEVDKSGRLRLILALARYTGRRESAIIQLRASDVMLSTERIAIALAGAGKDEGLAIHMPHGAIRWSAETDKQGVLHITPISSNTRTEIEKYLSRNHRGLADVPLFPGPKDATLPIARDVAARWLVRAEKKAEVSKLTGGIFHPYRRLWASERKHLSNIDVASAGGWKSTKTLAIYQQSDPVAVLAAVVNGS